MESGYARRFWTMWDSCGPGSWSTLFVSTSTIRECQAVASHPPAGASAADVAWARKVVGATVHPDHKGIIPWPFRMSAHVPCNTALLLAMLGASSPVTHVLAQAANQTFNAFQFYANRNASNAVSTQRLVAATTVAVTGAVASVLALDRYLARLPTGGRLHRVGRLFLPFVGAAAAKPFQIAIMRSDELTTGVAVCDESGATVGPRSPAAGRRAVGLTVATRVLYLVQPMLMPPLIMAALRRRWGAPSGRLASGTLAAINVLVVALSSAVMTPACIALFDQRASLPVSRLEPQVAAALRESGFTGSAVYFNKGI